MGRSSIRPSKRAWEALDEGMLKVLIAPVTRFQQNCSILWNTADYGGDRHRSRRRLRPPEGGGDLRAGHQGHEGFAYPRPCRPCLRRRHHGRALRGEDRRAASRRPVPDRAACRVWTEVWFPRPTGHSCPIDGSREAIRSPSAISPSRSCIVRATRRVTSCSCTSRSTGSPSWATCCSAGSIGRTDLPRGNHDQLVSSIRHGLWPLGDDIQFVPGHGQTSTFGRSARPTLSSPICCSRTTRRQPDLSGALADAAHALRQGPDEGQNAGDQIGRGLAIAVEPGPSAPRRWPCPRRPRRHACDGCRLVGGLDAEPDAHRQPGVAPDALDVLPDGILRRRLGAGDAEHGDE